MGCMSGRSRAPVGRGDLAAVGQRLSAVLDTELSVRGVGELVRYADDGVVLCRSAAQAEHALAVLGEILASLGLRLHPDKTKVVDLREGREGLDFLGCHFRACMSGRLWEQKRIVRYYLHRWPSQTAMARVRAKVRVLTGRNRVGIDIRDVIAALNPILRGWGKYFRTGNAARKFSLIDWYVTGRLQRLADQERVPYVLPKLPIRKLFLGAAAAAVPVLLDANRLLVDAETGQLRSFPQAALDLREAAEAGKADDVVP